MSHCAVVSCQMGSLLFKDKNPLFGPKPLSELFELFKAHLGILGLPIAQCSVVCK